MSCQARVLKMVSFRSGIKMICFLISVAPQITEHPQDVTAIEGTNVTFSCNASGDPSPTTSWTKGGSILITSGDSRISFGADNKTLIIINVNRADRGQYRCVANNSVGNDSTSDAATLNVLCKNSGLYFRSVFKG